jgi:hypothetical protein
MRAVGRSGTYRIAFGPRAGHKVLTVRGAMAREGTITRPALSDERVWRNAAVQVGLKRKTQFQWRTTCTQVMSSLRHHGAAAPRTW